MQLIVKIDMEGDAFTSEVGFEVREALQPLIDIMDPIQTPEDLRFLNGYSLRDTNGNRCGSVTVEE